MSAETHDHDHEPPTGVAVESPQFNLPPQFLVAGFQDEVRRLNEELARLNDNRVYLLGLVQMKEAVIASLSAEVERLRGQLPTPAPAPANREQRRRAAKAKPALAVAEQPADPSH